MLGGVGLGGGTVPRHGIQANGHCLSHFNQPTEQPTNQQNNLF